MSEELYTESDWYRSTDTDAHTLAGRLHSTQLCPWAICDNLYNYVWFAHAHPPSHARTAARIHTHTNTHTHTRARALARAHTYTHIHTHTHSNCTHARTRKTTATTTTARKGKITSLAGQVELNKNLTGRKYNRRPSYTCNTYVRPSDQNTAL